MERCRSKKTQAADIQWQTEIDWYCNDAQEQLGACVQHKRCKRDFQDEERLMKQQDMNEYRFWLGYAGIILAVIILLTFGAVWILN